MTPDINELKERSRKLILQIERQEGKRDQLMEIRNEKIRVLKDLNEEQDILEKVMSLFQMTSQFARDQAKNQIEALVTKCLQYIFDSSVEFQIELDELRNKASAEFYVVNNTKDFFLKTKPEQSRGGGVVDIVSLALRISFLQTHKPPISGPLILDEPAKHVSEEYIHNVGDFLKQTSEIFNRQVIMVTHNSHLAALSNSAYRVEYSGNTSIVTPIE
ncbi:ATPase [Gudongella oleilytica]|jgi:DNA repair ATPase RecN|uniref:ATPase n=1 Tax=Gudongella oleilytica TaxID=1582259 RepID=UPI000EBABF9B|nr:ATPase [Gudongella oleilytica]MDY0255790.1 ATPase [Gudongella oleilytica]HCO18913.1 ATPase [Tissierellales bacterium]